MSTRVSDCETKHLVAYDIKTIKHLKKLNGKFYKDNEDDLKYHIVSKDDKHLLGKTIYVRSAATCALKGCACPMCIGTTSLTNMDIADGISAFESEEITKQLW